MKVLVLDSVYRQAKQSGLNQARAVHWDDDLLAEGSSAIGNGPELALAFREIGITSASLTINAPGERLSVYQNRLIDRGEAIARLPVVDKFLFRFTGVTNWIDQEVARLDPDIVYCLNINLLPPESAAKIRKRGIILAGQIASPLPPRKYFSNYNHIFSAMPSIVKKLGEESISSSHKMLGFNPVFSRFAKPWENREITSIFIGSLGRHHKNSFALLRAAADADPNLRIYSPTMPRELHTMGLTENYHGRAFGTEMYQLLGNSKLVINRHAGFAKGLSANLRMYEATGMGAALLTEKTENLTQIFDENEVYSYKNLSDVRQVVSKLQTEEGQIRQVASRGNIKTIERHTVTHRAREIARELERLIGGVS